MEAAMAERASDLLTSREVAELLRRPEGTLRQWRHRNFGPEGFRMGGVVVYRRSAVEAFIAECEAATGRGSRV
jgi:predicted DNA-binding transcriptional regulator AlpA